MPSRPPLLLLAGWTQSSRAWDRFLPWLDGFRVIAVDNRETGAAGPCPEGFTLEDLAADALAAMDREVRGPFSVVGHSMGGAVAQALAFHVPERIERLTLVSTWPGRTRGAPFNPSVLAPPEGFELPDDPEEAALAMRAMYYERCMAPASDRPIGEIAREEAQRAQGNSAGLDGLVRQLTAMREWDPPDELSGLGLDVSVVHGELDPLVPYANGEIVAQLAGVRPRALQGIGHMVPWEAPDELAGVINRGQ